MPEAPEVETIRQTLLPCVKGRRIVDIRQSRFPLRTRFETSSFRFLEGQQIKSLRRHGKMLWAETSDVGGFIVRLGMSGQFLFTPQKQKRAPHTHVTFSLEDAHQLRYVDPRRFGEVIPFQQDSELDAYRKAMGPDVLDVLSSDNQALIVQKLKGTTRAIKDVLLDQKVIAGLGNIYVCEVLFLARLSPFQTGNHLSNKQIRQILEHTVKVNQIAISNGGTTLSDYRDGHGQRGRHQHHLAVFQRGGDPCMRCETPIENEHFRGRSTFFCPACQSC